MGTDCKSALSGYLGISIDEEKNHVKARKLTEIHDENSKVKVLIIPTNEESEIAKQSYELLTAL